MFDNQYEAFLADSPVSRKAHYRIRYKVFCLERGFEDTHALEGGEEKDKWDEDAVGFVVRDKGTHKWSATARLILPGSKPLPIEEHGCLDHDVVSGIGKRNVAEVSRICVVKGKDLSTYSDIAPISSSKKQSIALLGLIRSIMYFSLDAELPYLYMLITPAFARLLRTLGVSFVQAGAAIEHRGTRLPYLIDVKATQREIAQLDNEISEMFDRRYSAYKSFKVEDKLARQLSLIGQPPANRILKVASG